MPNIRKNSSVRAASKAKKERLNSSITRNDVSPASDHDDIASCASDDVFISRKIKQSSAIMQRGRSRGRPRKGRGGRRENSGRPKKQQTLTVENVDLGSGLI